MTNNNNEIHNMSMVVGGLKNAVETMTKIWQQQEMLAGEGRRLVHDKIDAMKDELRSLSSTVKALSEDVAEIKPEVEAFNADKLRLEGAKSLGTKLWAAMMAMAGALGWGLNEFLTWMKLHH
jgi:outer membrane murein-binding lipoprotein Lpp